MFPMMPCKSTINPKTTNKSQKDATKVKNPTFTSQIKAKRPNESLRDERLKPHAMKRTPERHQIPRFDPSREQISDRSLPFLSLAQMQGRQGRSRRRRRKTTWLTLRVEKGGREGERAKAKERERKRKREKQQPCHRQTKTLLDCGEEIGKGGTVEKRSGGLIGKKQRREKERIGGRGRGKGKRTIAGAHEAPHAPFFFFYKGFRKDSKAVPVRAVSPPSSAVSPPASSVLIASTLLSLAALIVALHEDSKAVPIRDALLLPWPPPPSSTRGASTAGDSSGRGDGRALVRRGRQGRGGGARGRTRAARERGAVSPGEDDSSGGPTGAHPRHRGEARENHGSIAPQLPLILQPSPSYSALTF